MKTYKFLFGILLSILLISACRKDSIQTDIGMTTPDPQTNVEVVINGFVTDRDGVAIQDASVKVLNKSILTNELGFFELTGLVNSDFALIEVEKLGYFKQFETIRPSEVTKNRIRIQLTERISSGTLSASTGGTISINQGSSVEFQANSFVDENGVPYTGEVTVYSFFIDPTDDDIDQIMPGNLIARNSANELNVLQSFGMVNVELEGQNGQQLNINQAATIIVEVPSTIATTAPSEIPLWYFDESDGLWKEEGAAVLTNGKYIGEVNHFTFWNCDVGNDVAFGTGQVTDIRGNSIFRVRITDLSTGASFTDWTDSEGFFEGGVPQNTNLLLEILGFCGDDVIFSTNIGPFTNTTEDLGIYDVSNNSNISFISGTLVGCDLLPLNNGIAFINLPNQSLTIHAAADALGNFSALVPTCGMEEIEIRGMNLTNGLISQITTVLPNNTINLNPIEVCTNISATLGSILMNVGGEQKTFDNCIVTINENNGATNYLYQYYDVLSTGVDTLHYFWAMTELNNDLTNPDWDVLLMIYSPPADVDDVLYNTYTPYYQDGVTNLTVTQIPNNSGDLMEISLSNLTINVRTKGPNGLNSYETFNGSTMMLSAVVQ